MRFFNLFKSRKMVAPAPVEPTDAIVEVSKEIMDASFPRDRFLTVTKWRGTDI